MRMPVQASCTESLQPVAAARPYEVQDPMTVQEYFFDRRAYAANLQDLFTFR
jgi:hypothetical protein